MLQNITTKQPDDKMIEVSIAALKDAFGDEYDNFVGKKYNPYLLSPKSSRHYNQEILNLTQRPDDEDDTGGDGPELPKVVPIGEEIEEYEGTYAMSPWERMKANQAKRALLVQKGIIQDSPIVDESVTDITMQANKGGLANLFRVKNQ